MLSKKSVKSLEDLKGHAMPGTEIKSLKGGTSDTTDNTDTTIITQDVVEI